MCVHACGGDSIVYVVLDDCVVFEVMLSSHTVTGQQNERFGGSEANMNICSTEPSPKQLFSSVIFVRFLFRFEVHCNQTTYMVLSSDLLVRHLPPPPLPTHTDCRHDPHLLTRAHNLLSLSSQHTTAHCSPATTCTVTAYNDDDDEMLRH